MKRCPKCKIIKEDNCFSPDRRVPSGLQSQCRECWNLYQKSRFGAEYQRKRIKEKKDKYGLGAGTIGRYGFKLALYIYEKFDRKCVRCGSMNDLTLHHLDGKGRNNAEKGLPVNNKIDNLILICRKCHGSIHGKEHGKNKIVKEA